MLETLARLSVRVGFVKRARRLFLKEETIIAYLFILPLAVAFALFQFYPVIYSFQLSLTDWNGFTPTRNFIGFANYTKLLSDGNFLTSLFNTVYYTIGHVALTMAAGLAAALAVNQRIRLRAVFRTLLYTPNVTPYVAASIVWLYFLNADFGLLNWLLALLGLPAPDWLGDPKWAMPALIIFSVWKSIGYHMIIYLAGLQSIPDELYEAARIDGAGEWSLLRHVTWPLLTPITLYLLVLSMISSFKVFTSIFVMTQGGPAGATSVLVYRIYQHAFQYFEIGYASAISYVLFAIVLVLTLVMFRIARTRVHYIA